MSWSGAARGMFSPTGRSGCPAREGLLRKRGASIPPAWLLLPWPAEASTCCGCLRAKIIWQFILKACWVFGFVVWGFCVRCSRSASEFRSQDSRAAADGRVGVEEACCCLGSYSCKPERGYSPWLGSNTGRCPERQQAPCCCGRGEERASFGWAGVLAQHKSPWGQVSVRLVAAAHGAWLLGGLCELEHRQPLQCRVLRRTTSCLESQRVG